MPIPGSASDEFRMSIRPEFRSWNSRVHLRAKSTLRDRWPRSGRRGGLGARETEEAEPLGDTRDCEDRGLTIGASHLYP
jgi:hypothetical protein